MVAVESEYIGLASPEGGREGYQNNRPHYERNVNYELKKSMKNPGKYASNHRNIETRLMLCDLKLDRYVSSVSSSSCIRYASSWRADNIDEMRNQ